MYTLFDVHILFSILGYLYAEPLSKRGWSSFGGGYGKRAALDDDYQEALDVSIRQ